MKIRENFMLTQMEKVKLTWRYFIFFHNLVLVVMDNIKYIILSDVE